MFSATSAMTAGRNIVVSSGASLAVEDGDLTLSANQQGAPTSGTFVGIEINGSLVTTSGSGAITLLGRGGDSGNSNRGVFLTNGGTVSSTAAKNVAKPPCICGIFEAEPMK